MKAELTQLVEKYNLLKQTEESFAFCLANYKADNPEEHTRILGTSEVIIELQCISHVLPAFQNMETVEIKYTIRSNNIPVGHYILIFDYNNMPEILDDFFILD